MARKRRAPSPPPPPPHESSTESATDTDGDADAFHMRPVSRTPTKPAASAPHPESEADDDESSESESEPEVPEPVQKKAGATTNKSKTAATEDKKRPAPEPAPSGRAKKSKAEAGKAAPEATPAGKGKKANAELEKAAPEATPAGKGKKAKKHVGEPENSGLDPSPPSKPARAVHKWLKEDLIKILEAMAAHVKTEGALPKTDVILAAVRNRLDRKDCTYSDIYEKVRRLKERYEKAVSSGVVPSGEDDREMYNLSDAVWGEKAKEAMAAAASQNDSTMTKSKRGQAKKEKMDGNSKEGTVSEVPDQNADNQKGSKKGRAVEVKTDKDVKSKLSKEEHTPAASPSKSRKLGNGKQESGKDAKSSKSKETATTAPQNDDAMTKRKGDRMDIDLMPKEASTVSQNGGARVEEETHQEETETGASVQVQGTRRSFDELQDLYPCLAWYVKNIEVQHPCGETLKRAFGYISNEKANVLESKVKDQRLLEMKAQIHRADIQKDVLNMLVFLAD